MAHQYELKKQRNGDVFVNDAGVDIGKYYPLFCGHVGFQFVGINILFHFNVKLNENGKIIEMIYALQKLNIEYAGKKQISVKFAYELCTIDGMIMYKSRLDERILEVLIEESKPRPNFAKGYINGNKMRPRDTENMHDFLNERGIGGDSIRSRTPRKRPLSASESVAGFIEYVTKQMRNEKDIGKLIVDEETIVDIRAFLIEHTSEFYAMNNLPRYRDGWRKWCEGI